MHSLIRSSSDSQELRNVFQVAKEIRMLVTQSAVFLQRRCFCSVFAFAEAQVVFVPFVGFEGNLLPQICCCFCFLRGLKQMEGWLCLSLQRCHLELSSKFSISTPQPKVSSWPV